MNNVHVFIVKSPFHILQIYKEFYNFWNFLTKVRELLG